MVEPNKNAFIVTGKVAIITGAGSGINYEFAKLLLSRNCSVVIGDLGLRPDAQELVDKYNDTPKAIFHRTDVTDWTSLQALFTAATAEFGTFDLVCPGAGIFEEHWSNFWLPPGSPESKDTPQGTAGVGHYKTLDINVTHPIRAPSNPKRVAHIASIASQIAALPFPLYVASKHAVDGFVRSLANLDKLNIRVNGVQPGMVRTPLWLDHPEKLAMRSDADVWTTPVEVAEAMLKCVEDPEVVGGTMLEVGHNVTRAVPLFGNMGSKGEGFGASATDVKVKEVFDWLAKDGWGKSV